MLSTQHISTHQLHCTCTTGTVVSTHAYCWHSAHTKETTVSQFTFSHICVHSVLKCAKAYKSAKAWTAHVKEPKAAPFFRLGKSLSSPVFGRKVQNLNLWVTNLANEALVIINSPSDVGRVRFNKPPIFNHVRRWRDLLVLGSPQTCHTVDLGRMSSNREILGLIAFCYHGGRLSWKRRGTFLMLAEKVILQ